MDEKTIDAIHRILGEIAEAKAEAKTIKEQLSDIAEQNDDYRELEEELKDLAVHVMISSSTERICIERSPR